MKFVVFPLFWVLIGYLWPCNLYGQKPSYNFHKLGIEAGLSDGIIRAIDQDKYGYIWVASVGGLSRYNGKNFTVYTNIPGDNTSPYGSQARCIHKDKKGNLWIGQAKGLIRFDYAEKKFIRYPKFENKTINRIVSVNDHILFIGTRKGLLKYDIKTDKIFDYAISADNSHKIFQQNSVYHLKVRSDTLYVGSHKGLIYLDLKSDHAILENNNKLVDLPVPYFDIDRSGNIWINSFGKIKLAKLHKRNKTLEIFDHVLEIKNDNQTYHVPGCLVDQKNRLWVITTQVGLMLYDSVQNNFTKIKHKEYIPSSPAADYYRYIFEDNSGLIWLGYEVEGISYFNPDKDLFTTILPFSDIGVSKLNKIGRAITEDKKGNIWMGNNDGISKYDLKTNQYTVFRNKPGEPPVLYSNHVRSMLCDKENNVWIGTTNGVNKYNSKTNKIEFVTDLPQSFYNSINEDAGGNVWFCTNDSISLYTYSLLTKKFDNISRHPYLKKYAGASPTSYVLEDSKGRIWISVANAGAIMFDKRTNLLKHFVASDNAINRLIGNQVIDIKEDKKGIVWLGTFNGISGIDVEKDTFYNFNIRNGMPGNMTGPLVIDDQDRIWTGTNGGLTMIEKNRKTIKVFKEIDGLSTTGFGEHAGIKTSDGKIIFPCNLGYIYFDPSAYKEEANPFDFYITSSTVFDKERKFFNEETTLHELYLSPDKTSFSFQFTALNYKNPNYTYFAYKLDGFEDEWHYTTSYQVSYSNMPAGEYTFLLKASDSKTNWENIPAKEVKVYLDEFFYKTLWFKSLVLLLIAGLVLRFYQYRTSQQRQLYELKAKTQALEKEKATAMFENLKQQLNPHFLFNSLTSLSGLIELDKNVASKFLNQMSVIYRYILKNADAETVSLQEEIDFVKRYINIQTTRFNEGFKVNMDIPDEYFDKKIAPVTLQNMIENAIKHNIIDKKRPLVIDIFVENNLYLVVKNNVQRKTIVETSNKKGLIQFVTLYKYLSRLPVIIDESDENIFQIKIPFI